MLAKLKGHHISETHIGAAAIDTQHGEVDLSIVIVNWNTRDLLAQCLRSVYDMVQGLKYEVIVVDNGSSDGSTEMVRVLFPQVILIANDQNRGFAAANNQAIARARGRYVLLLNSDTVVLPGSLEKMAAFLDEHLEVAAVGPMLIYPDGAFQSSYNDFPGLIGECLTLAGLSRKIYNPYYPSYPPEQSREQKEVDWVGGGCLMVRRIVLEEVKALDEGYFMYVEETDLCYRLHQAGWRIIYLPDARIVHLGGQSASQQADLIPLRMFKSKQRFFRKHCGRLTTVIYTLTGLVLSLLKTLYWGTILLSSRDTHRRTQAERRVGAHLSIISYCLR